MSIAECKVKIKEEEKIKAERLEKARLGRERKKKEREALKAAKNSKQ